MFKNLNKAINDIDNKITFLIYIIKFYSSKAVMNLFNIKFQHIIFADNEKYYLCSYVMECMCYFYDLLKIFDTYYIPLL